MEEVQVLHRMRDQLAAQQQQLVLLAPPGSPAHAVLDLVHLPHRTDVEGPNGTVPAVHQPDRAAI